ncbi:hypothetical protein [Vibrio cincinnatiensis]|uniref:hypothetical protein n=1 Tax=Vibrio cincinnatiensis TaxID=675 RepID=UPI001EDF6FA9|nr:hypothetical protein [Vibrio cincinnatiensis]MCG3726301.1 hypothetical protein [Vibrio cincinnatiensis]
MLKNDPHQYKTLDYNKYEKAFQTKDKTLLARLRNDPFESIGLSDVWEEGQACFTKTYPSSSQVPDISVWGTFLLLNRKAYEALKDQISDDVEFLPIQVDGQAFTFANVLSFCREDMVKTTFDSETNELNTLFFDGTDLNRKIVFKSKLEGCLNLYATETLMNLCNNHGLNGIHFERDLVNFFVD